MRTYPALVTFDEEGAIRKREKVSVMYTAGEPHPKDRIVCIELPAKGRIHQAVYLSVKMLEAACGLKIKKPR